MSNQFELGMINIVALTDLLDDKEFRQEKIILLLNDIANHLNAVQLKREMDELQKTGTI